MGRQKELAQARALCLGPVNSYITLIGARQTGKTSFLYRLQKELERQVRCVPINLQMIPGTAPPELFRFMAQQIATQLDLPTFASLSAQIDNGSGFEHLLRELPHTGQNIAVLVDEISALPPTTAIYMANVLRAIFSDRLHPGSAHLARFVFLLSGGIELLNLGMTETSPFSSIAAKIFLPDLTLGETKQLMAHGFAGEPVKAGLVHELAESIYDQVHGHPYLTQRIGASLSERVEAEPGGPDRSGFVQAVDRAIRDDNNIRHVRSILKDPALLHTAFQVLRHPTPSRYLSLRQERLRLLGIVRDQDGVVIPRNALYAQLICQLAEEAGVTKHAEVEPLVVPTVSVILLTSVVPTAFCHNLTADDFPLVEIAVDNRAHQARTAQVYAQSFIEGFSDATVASVMVPPDESGQIALLPVLQHGACSNLNEIRPATLRVTIRLYGSGSEFLLHDQTYPVQLHAFDTALLGICAPDGSIVDLTDYLSAFVTPHAPEVEDLLRKALNHHPKRKIVGYQGASAIEDARRITREQVEAIYSALKRDAGLAYVNSPLNFGKLEGQITQRVRLPSTSIHEDQSRANCIDGSVLYASLLELADLQPLIVIVPGHAFVGWRVWRDVDQFEFLETTLIGADSFENALRVGRQQYRQARDKGYFGRELFDPGGFARLIDVAACRAKRIYPLL